MIVQYINEFSYLARGIQITYEGVPNCVRKIVRDASNSNCILTTI